MIDANNVASLVGAEVIDAQGEKIGKVGQVYVDPTSGQPNWATVRTGFFGSSESFVPLDDASSDGDTVRVSFPKDLVKDAPRVDVDGELAPADEELLYRHYNRDFGTGELTGEQGAAADYEVGHDASGPSTDGAMTRSEEQLHVGTEKVESGRARLRKYVVTENQSVTVPVTHEEVRLEREPITDATIGNALDGPEISEEEHEVILTEERIVVSKETVPVERVRVGTEAVTENRQVNEQVRKEKIELEDGTAGVRDSGTAV